MLGAVRAAARTAAAIATNRPAANPCAVGARRHVLLPHSAPAYGDSCEVVTIEIPSKQRQRLLLLITLCVSHKLV